MEMDPAICVADCILDLLDVRELYYVSLTCKTLWNEVLNRYGNIVMLPNGIPILLTNNKDIRKPYSIHLTGNSLLHMTDMFSCFIQCDSYPNMLYCASHHSYGFVPMETGIRSSDPLTYSIRGNFLEQYDIVKDSYRLYTRSLVRSFNLRIRSAKFSKPYRYKLHNPESPKGEFVVVTTYNPCVWFECSTNP